MPRLDEIPQLGMIIQDEVTLGGVEIEVLPKHTERDGLEGLAINNGAEKSLRFRTKVIQHFLALMGCDPISKLLWWTDDRIVEVNEACDLHPWRGEVDVSLHRILRKAATVSVFFEPPVLGVETEENQGFGRCLFSLLEEQPLFPFAISAHLDLVSGCYGKFIF